MQRTRKPHRSGPLRGAQLKSGLRETVSGIMCFGLLWAPHLRGRGGDCLGRGWTATLEDGRGTDVSLWFRPHDLQVHVKANT